MKEKQRKLNKPLIRKIIAYIEKKPKMFSMTYFYAKREWKTAYAKKQGDIERSELVRLAPIMDITSRNADVVDEYPCGTVACICGLANMLEGRLPMVAYKGSYHFYTGNGPVLAVHHGADLLGIDRDYADKLFMHSRWPDEYYDLRLRAGEPKAAVQFLKDLLKEGPEVLYGSLD